MEIIIEEISRNEKLLHRHKFLTHEINIGRGYHNDIILADPHVCPEHLTIKYQDDQWIIEDNSHVNGSFLYNNKKKQSFNQHPIQSGDIIRLGKSQIRLILPEHPVEPAVPFSYFEGMIDTLRNPWILALNIILFTFVAGMMFSLEIPKEVSFSQFIVRAVGITLVFSIWPILFALLSHFNKHEARIFTQLAISFALFNLMWFSDILESIVAFNFSNNGFISSITSLLPILLTFALIWFNCYIGFNMAQKRRTIIAVAITTLLFGGNYLLERSKQPEFTVHPNYNATIMPPTFKLASSTTVNNFINNSKSLFTKAEKAAQKKDK